MVALARKRGVRIDGPADRPVALARKRGTFSVTAVSCACPSFTFVAECQHHALFLAILAEREPVSLSA